MNTKDSYYYADRQRVNLEADAGLIAVDVDHASVMKMAAPERRHLHEAGWELRRNIRLLPRDSLDDGTREALDRSGAALPVFRHGETLLVVLPEVRVSDSSPAGRTSLREYLKHQKIPSNCIQQRAHELVIRPPSGRGEDALLLANAITENLHPEMSQARFLRVVPRDEFALAERRTTPFAKGRRKAGS